jgi:hypothetical protein
VTVRTLENHDWFSTLNAKRLIQGQWTGLIGDKEEDDENHEEDGVAVSEVSPAAFVRIYIS